MAQVDALQLEAALRSPIIVEQAAGILAARHGLDLLAAFEVLELGARADGSKMHELARRVIAEEATPTTIVRYVDSRAS